MAEDLTYCGVGFWAGTIWIEEKKGEEALVAGLVAKDADGGEEGDDGGVEFESFDDVVLEPWHFLYLLLLDLKK